MPKVLDTVLESFYERLAESDAVNEATVTELRTLFASGKKPKPDDFVEIFEKAEREGTSRDSD